MPVSGLPVKPGHMSQLSYKQFKSITQLQNFALTPYKMKNKTLNVYKLFHVKEKSVDLENQPLS